jgi:hypothetical protein
MPALVHAIFQDTEVHHISVSVSLIPSDAGDSLAWLVKARSTKNPGVIVFRRFASIALALGFASEVLRRGVDPLLEILQ